MVPNITIVLYFPSEGVLFLPWWVTKIRKFWLTWDRGTARQSQPFFWTKIAGQKVVVVCWKRSPSITHFQFFSILIPVLSCIQFANCKKLIYRNDHWFVLKKCHLTPIFWKALTTNKTFLFVKICMFDPFFANWPVV